MSDNYELESQTESLKRKREIDTLVQIIEREPRYRPWFISDRASLLDIFGDSQQEIKDKLEAYFGNKLEISLDQPIWKLVDELKRFGFSL